MRERDLARSLSLSPLLFPPCSHFRARASASLPTPRLCAHSYIEGNFRTLQFILTRAPRRDDFPREKLYREDALDLLQRHYYKNTRS